MSDDAIRLELSQERLRRELAKGPANYRAIARAELEVRRSEQQLRGENERLERQFRETTRQADRMGRGMLAGSGALRGLGRNLAFASAGFLGGTGLVYGMRTAISAASNLEEQTNKTRVTFREAGDEVVAWSSTTATTLGIASDQALQYASTLGGILNVSGLARDESARLSRELVGLAADMASFNNVPIDDALTALRSGLVGESEPLRKLQVLLSETTVKQEAYRMGIAATGATLTEGQKVQARYSLIMKQTGDQQGDFARTQDGLANSQRTLSALWREAQIIVGTALVPSFKDAVGGLREWFAEDKNREEIQRTVNQLVKDGEQVIRGLVDAMRIAKQAAEPLVDALGGVANAIETIALVWLAMKAKAVLGFGGTAAASRATSAAMVRDATVAGRAWDIATRPRVMTVTTVGGGVPGAPGRGPGGRIPPVLLGNPALITAGVILSTPGASGAGEGDRRAQKASLLNGPLAAEYPTLSRVFNTVAQGIGTPRMVKLIKSLGEPPWSEGKLESAERQARRLVTGPFQDEQGKKPPPPTTKKPPPGGKGPGGFTFESFTAQQATLQERLLDAEATPGTADDVRVWRAELALVRRALRELELTRDQRVALKSRRNALLAELARIEQQEEQEAQAIKDKQAAARKAAREKREAREKAEQEAEEKQMERTMKRAQAYYDRMAKLTKGIDFTTREGLRKAALRGIDPKTGKPKGMAEDKALTKGELEAMMFDFARGLHGTIGAYAGNVGDSAADYGMQGTQAQMQTLELREQTAILREFTGAMRHPMTAFHKSQAGTLLTGYGF